MLLLAAAITVAVLAASPFYQSFDWQNYGYAGIFLLTLLTSATVIFPVPGIAAAFLLGGALNPFIVAAAAGFGSALGEFTGYFAGYGGAEVVDEKKHRWLVKFEEWMKKPFHGFLLILVLALIPNPMFDLAGIAAGSSRYPAWKFFAACLIGKTLKALALALMGARFLPY